MRCPVVFVMVPPPLISVSALLLSVLMLTMLVSSFVVRANVLLLERAIPLTQRLTEQELNSLRAMDRARHARILQNVAVGGIVNFPVQGTSDPYAAGLYFTKVKLGSPPRLYNVQIDTGSDILWITCSSCNDCPQSSGLGVQLSFYDAASSSTAGLVSCSNPTCSVESAASQCSQDNLCSYSFHYGDGSGTSGHYVSDILYFSAILGESLTANSSTMIVFGCSTSQSGDLTKPDKAIDGIFGFGQGDLSVISQLSSRGITPRVFSHCLKGDGNGGGVLVLGEILEPNIVYSPLVPLQPHYNLELQSISVNGMPLQIDPQAFATSNGNGGTIIDSGTTLAYLVAEAFDPFVSGITASVPASVTPTVYKGTQCYMVTTSIAETFPLVSLNFAGGASIVLKPNEYLAHSGPLDGSPLWCIAFQKSTVQQTILGDLVLKDKIFVYDIAHQRIGWADYDCSLSVNVSLTTGKDFINAGQLSMNSSSRDLLFKLIPKTVMALVMHLLLVFIQFQFF